MGFQPIVNETGRITGYKTSVGADTVFPFNNEPIYSFKDYSTRSGYEIENDSGEIVIQYDGVVLFEYLMHIGNGISGTRAGRLYYYINGVENTLVYEQAAENSYRPGFTYFDSIEIPVNKGDTIRFYIRIAHSTSGNELKRFAWLRAELK